MLGMLMATDVLRSHILTLPTPILRRSMPDLFFFNDTATTEIYTLSLHDALPISDLEQTEGVPGVPHRAHPPPRLLDRDRSEEHTSELQSRQYLVCRLLLEKKKIDDRLLLSHLHTER